MSSEPGPQSSASQCIITDCWRDDVVVIRCVGELDMVTVPDLERQVATALQKRPSSMIVDLSRVDFLGSVGMGLLVATHDNCGSTTHFAVVADGPATSRPMKLIGLTNIMTVYPTLDEALGDLRSPAASATPSSVPELN
jgi:anti-anti-sigma factor